MEAGGRQTAVQAIEDRNMRIYGKIEAARR
jgi:hypothetical protein